MPPGGEVITCTSCERPIRVDRPIAATDDPPLGSVGGGEATANWALTSIAWLIAFSEAGEQVGRLLAFQTYDPNAIANPVASR